MIHQSPWFPSSGLYMITIVLAGIKVCTDSFGNKYRIGPNQACIVCANTGIIQQYCLYGHSVNEMVHGYQCSDNPSNSELAIAYHGFDIWLNALPSQAKDSLCYDNITHDPCIYIENDCSNTIVNYPYVKVNTWCYFQPENKPNVMLPHHLPLYTSRVYCQVPNVHSSLRIHKLKIHMELDECLLYVVNGMGKIYDGENTSGVIISEGEVIQLKNTITARNCINEKQISNQFEKIIHLNKIESFIGFSPLTTEEWKDHSSDYNKSNIFEFIVIATISYPMKPHKQGSVISESTKKLEELENKYNQGIFALHQPKLYIH